MPLLSRKRENKKQTETAFLPSLSVDAFGIIFLRGHIYGGVTYHSK